jgi:hypothetical protein
MGRVKSLCPWFIAEEDVNPAESGLFSRDLQMGVQAQRHYGLQVLGTFDPSLSLGMLAIRCERKKGQMLPLAIAWVDAPPAETRTPAMDLTLLSAPVRHETHDSNDLGD